MSIFSRGGFCGDNMNKSKIENNIVKNIEKQFSYTRFRHTQKL